MTEEAPKRKPVLIEPKKHPMTGRWGWRGIRTWKVLHGNHTMWGVVATEPMAKGSRFEYFGKTLDKAEFDELKKKGKDIPHRLAYVVQVSKTKYIDAYYEKADSIGGRGKWIGAKVNEPEAGDRPNCKLVVYRGKPYVGAIRDILIGEELTMNYGSSYKRAGYSKSKKKEKGKSAKSSPRSSVDSNDRPSAPRSTDLKGLHSGNSWYSKWGESDDSFV
jgi:hypothetical protein